MSALTDPAERVYLTLAQALAALPGGDRIHTILQGRHGVLIGADWDRADVVAALTQARVIEVSGPAAQGTGHGLAIPHGVLSTVFIETAQRTDEEAA